MELNFLAWFAIFLMAVFFAGVLYWAGMTIYHLFKGDK